MLRKIGILGIDAGGTMTDTFIVDDTGIGIDEEQINYIFDPFYQSSKEKEISRALAWD